MFVFLNYLASKKTHNLVSWKSQELQNNWFKSDIFFSKTSQGEQKERKKIANKRFFEQKRIQLLLFPMVSNLKVKRLNRKTWFWNKIFNKKSTKKIFFLKIFYCFWYESANSDLLLYGFSGTNTHLLLIEYDTHTHAAFVVLANTKILL